MFKSVSESFQVFLGIVSTLVKQRYNVAWSAWSMKGDLLQHQ